MSLDAQSHFGGVAAIRRAQLLLAQGRAADAAEQLRLALSANPQLAEAHAMLALAQLDLQQFADATGAAERAVAIEPDEASYHYVLGLTFLRRNRVKEARAAADAARQLDPHEPNHWALLSACAAETQDWKEALAHADEGLSADPEHERCRNLRAQALRSLGRHDEAAATLRGALERRPDSSFTHANTGWGLLQRGGKHNVQQALEHFREALRLDPSNDMARAGMVEALKARYLVYRLMLRFFFWMATLKPGARWAVILGAVIGVQFVRAAAESNPTAGTFLWPVYYAYVAFALLTWLSQPLFNLLLRLNKFGRHALTDDQRKGSTLVGLLLGGAVLFLVGLAAWIVAAAVLSPAVLPRATVASVSFLLGTLLLPVVVGLGLLTLPASAVYAIRGTGRLVAALLTAGLGALWLVAVGATVVGWAIGEGDGAAAADGVAGLAASGFLLGLIASQFVLIAVGQHRPRL